MGKKGHEKGGEKGRNECYKGKVLHLPFQAAKAEFSITGTRLNREEGRPNLSPRRSRV